MCDSIDTTSDPCTRWEASDMLSCKTSLLESYLGQCLQVAHSHGAMSISEAWKELGSDN